MNLEEYREAYSFYEYPCVIRRLVKELHKDQKDKSGEPYIFHVRRVAENFPEESAAYLVALLHDTVEDTEIAIDDLRYIGLPESVLDAVDAITHRTHEPLVKYYARIKCDSLATKVKLADVMDNLRADRLQKLPEEIQTRLTRKYRRALKVLQEEDKNGK